MENLIGNKDTVIKDLTEKLDLAKEEAMRWHNVARDFQDENYKLRMEINDMRDRFSKLKHFVSEAVNDLDL